MAKLRFSSPEKQAAKQAASVIKRLQGNQIKSVGTVRNYEQALKNVALAIHSQGLSLRTLEVTQAINYLEIRAEEIGQKSLDMERQALQALFQHDTKKLAENERLEVIKSQHEQILEARAYTQQQVQEISKNQSIKNSLATEIAYRSGLRAHELLTIRRAEEQPADKRPAHELKFSGREGEIYTVKGKGGLVREVLVPHDLAAKLESRRFDTPQEVTDRGVFYQKNYDIGGGHNFSKSFSRVSQSCLGWSSGAHGLRHSYAQERMDELQAGGLNRAAALAIVSQELGHFRPEITEVYLR